MRRLFRQFSTPGGIPSHVSVTTPGSIHEGGELGYVLVARLRRRLRQPGPDRGRGRRRRRGRDRAARGLVEGHQLPQPGARRRGAADPAPERLQDRRARRCSAARATRTSRACCEATATRCTSSRATIRVTMHQALRRRRSTAATRASASHPGGRARGRRRPGTRARPRWPAIVLRTPEGLDRAQGGRRPAGRGHVPRPPGAAGRRARGPRAPGAARGLDAQLPAGGAVRRARPPAFAELAALAPDGRPADGREPARQRRHADAPARPARLSTTTRSTVAAPGDRAARVDAPARRDAARHLHAEPRRRELPPVLPRRDATRTGSAPCSRSRTAASSRRSLAIDDHVSPDGRVMEVLSEHLCEGWLEGYLLTGRHGLFATYEAFAMVSASMTVQHAKWLEEARGLPWRAPVAVAQHPADLDLLAQRPQRLQPPGPGLIDTMLSQEGRRSSRIYLPPDANCLLSVADHCFRSRNYVNLIVDRQAAAAAVARHGRGARALRARRRRSGQWASNGRRRASPTSCWPAPATSPTLETVAAAWLLRAARPTSRVRVVNVVDLMTLFAARGSIPHGMTDEAFVELFTASAPVVFAFHGYQRAVHQLLHGRPNAERFHVRGFNEEGTTTTPFDMVVLNEMSRYHLALEALRRAPAPETRGPALAEHCRAHARAASRATSASTSRTCPRSATGAGAGRDCASPPVVLCLNAGSSSLKFAVWTGARVRSARARSRRSAVRARSPGSRRAGGEDALTRRGRWARSRRARSTASSRCCARAHAGRRRRPAIGHRLVHGGPHHDGPARVDRATARRARRARRRSRRSTCRARSRLRGDDVATRFPGVPQVGCFDTAFHRTLPEVARRLPLPRSLARRGRAPALRLPRPLVRVRARAPGRRRAARAVISRTSATARAWPRCATAGGRHDDGRSRRAGGLVMGTRTGDLDPGAARLPVRSRATTRTALERLVDQGVGAARGLGRARATCATLLERARPGRGGRARGAMFFCRRAQAGRGVSRPRWAGSTRSCSPAASASTPRSCAPRSATASRHLGVQLDPGRNAAHRSPASVPGSGCQVRIVATREDLMIARHSRGVLFPDRERRAS